MAENNNMSKRNYLVMIALIVALGGFLMGFDASVISGVNKFVEAEFELTEMELGWAVASLTLISALSMLIAGPISEYFGRKKVLSVAALLFFFSALGSAFAPNYTALVAARMLGGLGVGASLIIAPMYIAEIAPPKMRGQMVSFNQLNIVIGISVAFFSNYLILQLGAADGPAWAKNLGIGENNWRWMLGVEAIPAILYFVALFVVPRSPRWLAMKGEYDEALQVLRKASDEEEAQEIIQAVKDSKQEGPKEKLPVSALFKPALRFVMVVGLVLGVLQQITGINSVFFYAPMIFEQSGIGEDASFAQAIWVGLVNLVFTLVAIALIDRLGRRPLLIFGVAGIVLSMFLLSYHFKQATYTLTTASIEKLTEERENALFQQATTGKQVADVTLTPTEEKEIAARIKQEVKAELSGLDSIANITYDNDLAYKSALKAAVGEEVAKAEESNLIKYAAKMNSLMILICILGFVASFAISIGPVMWVLLSELFPNWIRALAVSSVGFINSLVSYGVQQVFPWELANLGSSMTFLIYGVFALLGLVFIIAKVPETKGKSMEELEAFLIKK